MNLSPLLIQHFVDGNGNALVGGLLYTYAAGTSTPQATYTDSTGGTPNANPVVMNARGEADVWLNPALSYKFTLTDRYGTLIWTKDNVAGSVAAIPAAQYFGVDSGAANVYVVTLSGFVGTLTPSTGTVVEFYATNANTGASTLNVNSSGAAAILSQYGIALSGGEIQTSAPTWAQWNGSAWQIVTGISPACVRTAAEIAASVTPTNYAYPPGHGFRYGMVGDGTLGASTGTDNTAAFNNLVAVCRGGGTPSVRGFIPCGTYRFASKPATISSACAIFGESKGGVIFLRDYTESTATNGFIESNSGTLVFEDIYLLANNGHTGGAAIHLIGQASGASPDFSTLRVPYISGNGGGTWAYGILVDGSARVGPPAGVRDLFIDDTTIFACTTSCCTLKTVNNAQVRLATFPAGGSVSDLTITGVTGNTSNDITVLANFDATLNLDWCNYVVANISGSATITNTSNVNQALVTAAYVASAQANWLASQLTSPTGTVGNVSAGVGFNYGTQQSLIGTAQTISVAAAQTINTNAGVVQNINNTSGGNLTATILQAGTIPYQQIEVMNANGFTITFDVAATSNVADGASDVIPALTSRKFTWNAGLSRWYRSA